MKTQKKILIILFITITILLLLIVKNISFENNYDKKFSVSDTSLISKIVIETSDNKLELERKNNIWYVDSKFMARKKAIKMLLQTLRNIKIYAPTQKKIITEINNKIIERNKKISLYNVDNELLNSFYIGKLSPNKKGTYCLKHNAKKSYILNLPGIANNINKYFISDSFFWKNRTIFNFKLNEIKSVLLSYQDSSKSFELNLAKNNSYSVKQLQNKDIKKKLNTNAIKQYLSYFYNIEYQNIIFGLSKTKKDSIINSRAENIITITDILNNKVSLKTYKIKLDSNKYDLNKMYGVVDDDKIIVVINYYTIDPILKDISYFYTTKP